MFLKRYRMANDVKAGSVFRRVRRDNMIETARVLSVGEDCLGIPHVRFQVCFERPNRTFLKDARVLALESFARHYCGHAHA